MIWYPDANQVISELMDNWYIDGIYDWGLGYDRVGIRDGRGGIFGYKPAPYGGATAWIFIYEEGGSCMDIFGCYIDKIDVLRLIYDRIGVE